jgi:hypothetical protein
MKAVHEVPYMSTRLYIVKMIIFINVRITGHRRNERQFDPIKVVVCIRTERSIEGSSVEQRASTIYAQGKSYVIN